MTMPATVDDRLTQPNTPSFALGLGLTNECNLACAFCYRDAARVDRLTLEQVRAVMERIPVRSVNLGTGENGLHPEFLPILRYLRAQPIKLTMTTNGYSVAAISDADLAAFKDIEFSLDYPTEAEQDDQRGAGNWQLLHEQAARCRRLGVPVTFIAVMMQSNFDRLADIAAIAKAYDAPLRINVYQSVRTDKFALTYEQYWSGFERLFEHMESTLVEIGFLNHKHPTKLMHKLRRLYARARLEQEEINILRGILTVTLEYHANKHKVTK